MRALRAKSFIIILLLICVVSSAFSCSSPCAHSEVTSTVIPPTCDSEGYTLNKCNECSEEFVTDTLPALGHTATSSIVPPDCENDGYTQNVCTVCAFTYTSDPVPALGHPLSIEQTVPSCESGGFTHAKCTVCDYECVYDITEPTGHTPKATTTHVVSCKQPEGYTVYECTCGFSYTGDYKLYTDIYKGAFVENTTVLTKGVDTSRWSHVQNADGTYAPLDWEAVKEAGYDFALLRAGYIGVKDPVFEEDYIAARAAGLKLGVYFYTYADTVEEAREEAEYCLTLLEGKYFEYPVYFDIEDTNLEKLDKDTLTSICIEFISILQENGYYTSLYCNNNWLKNLLHTSQMTTLFDVWYARYPSLSGVVNEATWNTERYGKQMAMWQFSKTGIIEGITEADGTPMYFDLNYCYKDYPTIIKELGLNGLDKAPSE